MPSMDEALRLMTYEEVAEVLGYDDRRSVRALVRSGVLPGVTLSPRELRVRYVDLQRFIENGGIRGVSTNDEG